MGNIIEKNIFYPGPPTPFIEEQLHSPTAPCFTDPLVLPLASGLKPKGADGRGEPLKTPADPHRTAP